MCCATEVEAAGAKRGRGSRARGTSTSAARRLSVGRGVGDGEREGREERWANLWAHAEVRSRVSHLLLSLICEISFVKGFFYRNWI